MAKKRKQTLSERVRVARGDLSYAEYAEQVGLSKGTLWNVEHGKGAAIDTLKVLGAALGVPWAELAE